MLSLAMICRDNKDTIYNALSSVKPWVDELVIVDTGSKDNTIDIADGFSLFSHCVSSIQWKNDFALARNQSLFLCRHPWIFWMDSDEYLPPESGKRIREAVENAPADVGAFTVLVKNDIVIERVAIVRNHPQIRFKGRVHEQIAQSVVDAGYRIVRTDIVVEHRQNLINRDARNMELLKLEIDDNPQDQFALFKVGQTYLSQQRYADAIWYFQRSREFSNPNDNHLPKLMAFLTLSWIFTGDISAAKQIADQGVMDYPNDPEVWFYWAMVAHSNGRLQDAINGYERAATLPQSMFEADAKLPIKAYHNQAMAFKDAGYPESSIERWRYINKIDPTYGPAVLALKDE